MREQQAGFRVGRGSIDQIFILRRILEKRHTYRRPTIAMFLDLKGAFDSVDRSRLFEALDRNGMPTKYVNVIRAIYAHTGSQVRVCGELTECFEADGGVCPGCPLSLFLFNFVMNDVLNSAINNLNGVGVQLTPGELICDLEYADDVVCFFETMEDAQLVLDRLGATVRLYGIRFSLSKCKVLPQH